MQAGASLNSLTLAVNEYFRIKSDIGIREKFTFRRWLHKPHL